MQFLDVIDELQALVPTATAGHRGDIRRMIRSLSLPSANYRTEDRARRLIERVPIRVAEKASGGWGYSSFSRPRQNDYETSSFRRRRWG